MTTIIGTCSICSGPVVMSSMSVRPVPRCENCGATPRYPYGPVIQMDHPTMTPTITRETWDRFVTERKA